MPERAWRPTVGNMAATGNEPAGAGVGRLTSSGSTGAAAFVVGRGVPWGVQAASKTVAPRSIQATDRRLVVLRAQREKPIERQAFSSRAVTLGA